MTQGNPTSPRVRKSLKVPNGMSIPEILRNYPNILELYLKRPDRPRQFISPTLCYFFASDGITGRVRDRGKARGIWKHGHDLHTILELIDAEMGLDWPQWRFDDPRDAKAYSERKDSYRC